MYQCHYCRLKTFDRRSHLNQHQDKCIYRKAPRISKKKTFMTEKNRGIMEIVQSIKQDLKKTNNHLDTIKRKTERELEDMKNKTKQELEDMKKTTKEELADIKKNAQTTIINNINNFNNINITKELPTSWYDALVTKMGKQSAVKLLNNCSSDGNIVKIYTELFPSRRINDNPVFYENKEGFKYLDDNNLVSDDKIIFAIAKKIQAAMLYATNELITESIKLNKTAQLYDVYDIGTMQNTAMDLSFIEQQLSNYIQMELIG